MKKISHRINVSTLAVLLAGWGGFSVSANAITLDFEGLQDLEQIQNFYNGGTGSLGSAGPDYGIQFGDDSQALLGGVAFTPELAPSPGTMAFFLQGNGVVMNVAAGFDTAISFYYTAPFNPGFVRVWDGLNGTGNLLADIVLGVSASIGPLPYDAWAPAGAAFSGTAMSAVFGGVPANIGFDDITLGKETPNGVPDGGASALLLGIGLVSVGCFRRFRGMA